MWPRPDIGWPAYCLNPEDGGIIFLVWLSSVSHYLSQAFSFKVSSVPVCMEQPLLYLQITGIHFSV